MTQDRSDQDPHHIVSAIPVAPSTTQMEFVTQSLSPIEVPDAAEDDCALIIRSLTDVDWSFSPRSKAPAIESIHPYPAKFIGDIPRTLIEILPIPGGSVVLDPFCGSGTTLVEAQRAGISTVGIDLNPIGCLIARVKTSRLAPGFADAVADALNRAQTIRHVAIPDIPNLDHWFKPEIQGAVGALTQTISNSEYRPWFDQLRLALSSILVRVSNQDSDTRYAAVEKTVSREDVFSYFEAAADKLCRSLLARSWNLTPARIVEGDTLQVTPAEIGANVGLVITSPPYPNAYEYWLYHKYRMWWLGFDPISVKESEIGARAHFFKKNHHTAEQFREQMHATFKMLSQVVVSTGFVCFVIGRSKIHGEIVDNSEIIEKAAANSGLRFVTRFERVINPSRKSFNLSHANIKTETLLIFQKAPATSRRPMASNAAMQLSWHPYKYYSYERDLAHREIRSLLAPIAVTEHGTRIQLDGPTRTDSAERLVYFAEITETDGNTAPTVQSLLERSNGNGHKRQSTRYSVHGLHEYKGKFNPQVAKAILNIFGVMPGQTALDPFCGSGTTLVECAHLGIRSVGADVNPMAIFLANAKLGSLGIPARELRSEADSALARAQRLRSQPKIDDERGKYLNSWFPSEVLCEIERMRIAIESSSSREIASVLLAIVSNQLREYSLQEPHDLRIRRRMSPLPETPFFQTFQDAAHAFCTRLQNGQSVLGVRPADSRAVHVDCRHLGSTALFAPETFDAALTSPPYATALPYIDTQRLSLVWLSLLAPSEILDLEATLVGSREIRGKGKKDLLAALEKNEAALPHTEAQFCLELQHALIKEDGFRRQGVPRLLYRYFASMAGAFSSIAPLMKRDAPFALIVGCNHTTLGGTRFEIDTPRHLANIAISRGWRHIETVPLQTYQRYGLHMNNATSSESLLLLRA